MSEKLENHSESHLKQFVKNIMIKKGENACENIMLLAKNEVKKIVNIISEFGNNNGCEIDKKVVENRIGEILKNGEEVLQNVSGDDSQLSLCNFLYETLKQTKAVERQNYFQKMLEIYYQMSEDTIHASKGCNQELLKISLPYLKLKLMAKQLKENEIPLKQSLLELFECVACPKILREDCYQIVRNKVVSDDYEFIKFDLVPIEEKLGCVSAYFLLNITVKHKDIEKVLTFFAKCVPKTNDSLEILATNTFKREAFIYTEFIPKLKRLGIEDISNFAPKYFLSRANDFIILENLSTEEFYTPDITVPVSYDWLVTATRKLSEFHACSVILNAKISKENGDSIGKIYEEYLTDFYSIPGEPSYIASRNSVKMICDVFLEKLRHIPRKFSVEQFKEKILNEFRLVFDKNIQSEKYLNVICHRDLWCSNIISKKGLDSCCLIDFQIITYGPPAVDLLFMIYVNTERATRQKFFNELIKLYYSSLKRNVEKYEIDMDQVCTYEQFLDMAKEYASSAILMSLFHLQILLHPELQEIKKDEMKTEKFYFGDRREMIEEAWNYEPYRTRIGDLIEELYEILENK